MKKNKTRTQKAALNTSTAAIAELVQLICGLILPRLILRTFGSSYNGITSSARQFLSAVSILTVGITGATRVALYRSLADHDNAKTSAIIMATEKYMRKVGLVLLAFLCVLTVVYPLVKETGYTWFEVAPLIVAAGISASGRYFFGMPYATLLMADQSIYISYILTIIGNIMNVVISVILIKMGCNVQVVKLTSSCVLLAIPILRAVYVRKKYNLDRKCKPDYQAISMRRDVMAHSIANIVHDHTDIVVLTVFCDIKIISVYTTYNLIMNALKKMQRVFTTGSEAVFGNMWAKGEINKIRENLTYFEYIITAFAAVVFSTTMVMILPFISLYTKGVHDVEYILPAYALVITAAQMFYCLRTPYLTLVQGVGHYKQTKNGAYAEAAVNLVVSVILVQFIGIVGVALGTLIANIFRTVQYAVYIDNNLLHRGKMVFVKRIIWTCLNALIVVGVAYSTASGFAYSGWSSWVITAIAVTLLSMAVTLLSSLIFYRQDLRAAIRLLRRGVLTRLSWKGRKQNPAN